MQTSLSVLVPVYNEQYLVAASRSASASSNRASTSSALKVIVVDGCLTDETPRVLEEFKASLPQNGKMRWTFLRHEKNGARVRQSRRR